MFCSKCGHQNDDSAAFCNSCGAALQAAPTPVEEVSLTPKAKVRSGAILSLIGAALSLAVCLFMEEIFFDPTAPNNNFYQLDNLLMYLCGFFLVSNGVVLWKSQLTVGKILSIINLVLVIAAIFISLLCSLMGLIKMEVNCIFNPINTLAMVLLLLGSIKCVTGAFSRVNR